MRFVPLSRRRRGANGLSLRTRLLLLVVASVLPLVGMGLVREYRVYQTERDRVDEGLLTTARGIAVSVERDLRLRISAMETLATSPALQSDDLSGFDRQAAAFLARQPPDTMLGLVAPDNRILRAYGPAAPSTGTAVARTASAAGHQVFDTGTPLVTDLHVGHLSHVLGFSVDVPVFRDGHVAYDLYVRLRPAVMEDLVARQHLRDSRIAAIADATGQIVARWPAVDSFVGHPIVQTLWKASGLGAEGITRSPSLDGQSTVVAFTHVLPFNWTVVVGAPVDVVFAPLRAGVLRLLGDGALVLAAGLLLASLAARQITRPIEQLRRLAEHDDSDPPLLAGTGLAETDTVAQALVAAAAERRAAVQDLAESEQRFRDLFERSPSGIMLLDPETMQVLDSNEAAAAFVGYPRAEFRHMNILDLRLSSSAQRIRDIARSVVGGEVIRYEARVMGRQGPRDLFNAIGPLRWHGRTVLLISQIDVTELRQAESGLRLNEERLELARHGAGLGIWDWDITTNTLSWSEHQWHLHGLPPRPDGPAPNEWRAVLHPEDSKRVGQELRRVLKYPEEVFATEYTVMLPGGAERRLLARGRAVRDELGRPVRLVGINMDVTARYQAELARDRLIALLKTEQTRLKEIIDILPVGVGIVDPTGLVTLSNPTLRRFIGPMLPSMTDTPSTDWMAVDSEGRTLPPEALPVRRALCGHATPDGVEFLFRGGTADACWVWVASIPLRRDDGSVREALMVVQDIDAERRLIDLQQQANIRLEQRVKEEVAAREAAQQRAAQAERIHALGQIAGGIAHDFNNVLQAVSGAAALVEARTDNPQRVAHYIRLVSDAARRGAAITSRLLAFARRGDLHAEGLDPKALLTDMTEVLNHTLGGSVICRLEVPDGLPPLLADRGQLETVLVNLGTNARDAMPAGGELTMSASAETVTAGSFNPAGLPTGLPAGPPGGLPGGLPAELPVGLAAGDYVRICVSDTGDGMDPEVLAHVTEPFFTTKPAGKGTGLGLAMAKGFVEQSGGGLSIDSVKDKGTRVSLWLPQALSVTAAAEPLRPVEDEATHPVVLLVDDDPLVREVLAASLEEAGYRVQSPEDGAAALARLGAPGSSSSGRPDEIDILVTDLTMPAMDGLTLIRRAQSLWPLLPAVLLTGNAGDSAGLTANGQDSERFTLLRKPISGAQLVDAIAGTLQAARRAPPQA